VKVIAGRSKGKVGDVLRVLPTESRVVVSGVNVIKRHTKPGRTEQGGIIEREAAIHVSNVACSIRNPTSRPRSASSSSKTAGKCASRAPPAKQ
jgi:ribosomal protein L24